MKQSTPSTDPTPATSCRDHTPKNIPQWTNKQQRTSKAAKSVCRSHRSSIEPCWCFQKALRNLWDIANPAPILHHRPLEETTHLEHHPVNKQESTYKQSSQICMQITLFKQLALTFLWNKAHPAPILHHRPLAETRHLEHPPVNKQEAMYKQSSQICMQITRFKHLALLVFSKSFDSPMRQSKPSTHPTPPASWRDHRLRTSQSEPTKIIVQAKQPNLHVDHTVQASALRVFLKSFDNPMKQSTPSTHPTPPTSWRDYVLRTSHSEPKRINVQAKQPNLYVDRTVEASSPPRIFQDVMTFLWNKANPAPSLQHRPRAQTTHLEHPLVNTQEERYKQNS